MSIVRELDIVKVLMNYNSWWKTGKLIKGSERYIKRSIYNEVKQIFTNPSLRRFVILHGARKVGKTTFLYQIINDLLEKGVNPKNILYLNFDNPIMKLLPIEKLIEIYEYNLSEENENYIFLDEIQYVNGKENWLESLYDKNPYLHILATKSISDKNILKETGDSRWINVELPTLSFYEYCNLKNYSFEPYIKTNIKEIENLWENNKFEMSNNEIKKVKEKMDEKVKNIDLHKIKEEELKELIKEMAPLQKYFSKYLRDGGFPEIAKTNNEDYQHKIIKEEIISKILKRDIPTIYGTRNIDILEKVFIYLCLNSSSAINYSSMCKEIGNITVITLQEYLNNLQNANLIYISDILENEVNKAIKSRTKIYVMDSSIKDAILMRNDIMTDYEEMKIHIETTIYNHISAYMRKKEATIGYYRDSKKNKEIDIVANSIKEDWYIKIDCGQEEKTEIMTDFNEKQDTIFVITRDNYNYGIEEGENNKRIVKIPAYIFAYIIGSRS